MWGVGKKRSKHPKQSLKKTWIRQAAYKFCLPWENLSWPFFLLNWQTTCLGTCSLGKWEWKVTYNNQQENLLVLDEWRALFASPAIPLTGFMLLLWWLPPLRIISIMCIQCIRSPLSIDTIDWYSQSIINQHCSRHPINISGELSNFWRHAIECWVIHKSTFAYFPQFYCLRNLDTHPWPSVWVDWRL